MQQLYWQMLVNVMLLFYTTPNCFRGPTSWSDCCTWRWVVGNCASDGLYYIDDTTFVICSNGYPHEQPCPPGTKTSGSPRYQAGYYYGYTDLCSTNLVDFGYGPEYYAPKGYPVAEGYDRKDGGGYGGADGRGSSGGYGGYGKSGQYSGSNSDGYGKDGNKVCHLCPFSARPDFSTAVSSRSVIQMDRVQISVGSLASIWSGNDWTRCSWTYVPRSQ